MTIFAIGDVQGCYDKLMQLLDKIAFGTDDILWFVGDLVNRGPNSYKTLRFIRDLCLAGKAITVLGNHDLGTLAILRGAEPFIPHEHTFTDLKEAQDREELLLWLEQQPLLHHDAEINYTLVHAGLYPAWTLQQAQSYAREVENVLQDPVEKFAFYHHFYGNKPKFWDQNLKGFDRLRFIVNALTRMRLVSSLGELELETKESLKNTPKGFLPWFEIPDRKNSECRILFGHWALLGGKSTVPNVFPLDTGCVWGEALTAMRLQDQQRFSISCSEYKR